MKSLCCLYMNFYDMVIIVCGLPGSGKSFFARKLAKTMGARYINSDAVRFKMFTVRGYTAEEKEEVYAEMLREAKQWISQQRDVVLDATFYQQHLRDKFKDALTPATVHYIVVQAKDELIRSRLSKPRSDSEADYSIFKKIKAAWEPFKIPHQVIESSEDNIDDMLNQARQYLDEQK